MDQKHQRGRKELPIDASRHSTTLGLAVRAWRRYRGLKLTELTIRAGYTDTNRGYISKIEHGLIRHVGDEHLERIANALGIDQKDLLAGIFPPESHAHEPQQDPGVNTVLLADKAREAGMRARISQEYADLDDRSTGTTEKTRQRAGQYPSEAYVDLIFQHITEEVNAFVLRLLEDEIRPLLTQLIPAKAGHSTKRDLEYERNRQPIPSVSSDDLTSSTLELQNPTRQSQ